jgi:hypothetical protein
MQLLQNVKMDSIMHQITIHVFKDVHLKSFNRDIVLYVLTIANHVLIPQNAKFVLIQEK